MTEAMPETGPATAALPPLAQLVAPQRHAQLSPVEAFAEAIRRKGLIPPDTIIADGELHRFASNGKRGDDAGWYVLHVNGVPAGQFGCWRAGISRTWSAGSTRSAPAPVAATLPAPRPVDDEQQAAARAQALERWTAAAAANPAHPYLVAKGIQSHGVRQLGADLLVPLHDHATLHSVQTIAPDGAKRFLKGGRKHGCYCLIGDVGAALLIAEGFATAASLHEATTLPVAIAFDAGNLQPVARALRERFPTARIILCADDDQRTAGNPGMTKATEAARAVGGFVAVPDFGAGRPEGATDFNDLAHHRGAEAVGRAIANARAPDVSEGQADTTSAAASALARLPWVDVAPFATDEPPAVEWLADGWIPNHGATLIGAHGGAGKTVLAVQLALCVAAGVPFVGLSTQRQPVALILAETGRAVLHRRLARAAFALGVDLAELSRAGRLHVLLADDVPGGLALFGREPQLAEGGRTFLPPVAACTNAYRELQGALAARGVSALVVDPLTDVFDGEEINRRDVRAFVAAVRGLVPGPVILTAHVNRESVKTRQAGSAWSGSTAWHNSVRARLELLPVAGDDQEAAPAEDDGRRLLYLAKNNDGRSGLQLDVRLNFERWVFETPSADATNGAVLESLRRENDAQWLVRFITTAATRGDPVHAAQRANRNPHARVCAADDCPPRYHGPKGRRALFREINRLLESGGLKMEAQRTAARHSVEILAPSLPRD